MSTEHNKRTSVRQLKILDYLKGNAVAFSWRCGARHSQTRPSQTRARVGGRARSSRSPSRSRRKQTGERTRIYGGCEGVHFASVSACTELLSLNTANAGKSRKRPSDPPNIDRATSLFVLTHSAVSTRRPVASRLLEITVLSVYDFLTEAHAAKHTMPGCEQTLGGRSSP